MNESRVRFALTDVCAVLLVILLVWVACRYWLYPVLGIADNAPMILRPICGFLVAWWLLRERGERWGSLGLGKPASLVRAALIAILLYAVLAASSPWVSSVLAAWLPAEARPGYLGFLGGNLPATVCWIAIGCIVGGFGEEALFRGFLLNRVATLLGGGAFALSLALIAQAALFGLLHFYAGLQACAHAMYFAFLMGSAYLAGGRNLWPLMIVHGVWNTVAIWGIYSGG